jgi:hypothetical protein
VVVVVTSPEPDPPSEPLEEPLSELLIVVVVVVWAPLVPPSGPEPPPVDPLTPSELPLEDVVVPPDDEPPSELPLVPLIDPLVASWEPPSELPLEPPVKPPSLPLLGPGPPRELPSRRIAELRRVAGVAATVRAAGWTLPRPFLLSAGPRVLGGTDVSTVRCELK